MAISLQPCRKPSAHTHARGDEPFYTLEGSVRFTIGEHVCTASAGDYSCMPKKSCHQSEVTTLLPNPFLPPHYLRMHCAHHRACWINIDGTALIARP
ncbi:cupin domain-containing protein [Fibrella sp. HMF5405]|uniref:Cupin domain-containing protein n=1 Tax=Fibrella forsythiae TaxID=2817061 RepID=A0ABS3JT53_9BACT|nr:cupin domain-containing protein [Fibrella forsythiae]